MGKFSFRPATSNRFVGMGMNYKKIGVASLPNLFLRSDVVLLCGSISTCYGLIAVNRYSNQLF